MESAVVVYERKDIAPDLSSLDRFALNYVDTDQATQTTLRFRRRRRDDP
jgi:hypothetical protein